MANPLPDLTQYQVSKAVKWPDGVAYSTERIDSYRSSAHYEGSHGIACNDCHDAHAITENGTNQVRDTITRSGVTVHQHQRRGRQLLPRVPRTRPRVPDHHASRT